MTVQTLKLLDLDASVIDTSPPHRLTVGGEAHILDINFQFLCNQFCNQSRDRTFTCSASAQLVGCDRRQ